MKGKLIVFEGLDGSGKSTHAHLFHERLADSRLTCQPTTGPIGCLIREILAGKHAYVGEEEISYLFAADRIHHRRMIQHNLDAGRHVVSDRYTWSSLAYQSTGLKPISIEELSQINKHALDPEVLFYIDVSAEESAARRAKRGGKPERYENLARQEKVREVYEDLLTRDWPYKVYRIDSTGLSKEETADKVWATWLLYLQKNT